MRLASKVGESLRLIVISPSELASEPTSFVRGRLEDVLLLTNNFFDKLKRTLSGAFFTAVFGRR